MTPAERDEARRIMAIQASTIPAPDPATGRRDIGPRGAWQRASGVVGELPPTPELTGMGTRDGRRP